MKVLLLLSCLSFQANALIFLVSSRLQSTRIAYMSKEIIGSSSSTSKTVLHADITETATLTDNPQPKPRKSLNIPNTLSILRILCVPIFCVFFVCGKKSAGLSIYIASCITDFVDGYLARKLNQVTAFGAFLDPVADKLMVASALILLVCQLPVWWFALPVAIIICREILVSALRELMAERGQRAVVKVGNLGKIKTACQMGATVLLLASSPGASDFDINTALGVSRSNVMLLGLILLYAATALTITSGAQYFAAAWPVIKAESLGE